MCALMSRNPWQSLIVRTGFQNDLLQSGIYHILHYRHTLHAASLEISPDVLVFRDDLQDAGRKGSAERTIFQDIVPCHASAPVS